MAGNITIRSLVTKLVVQSTEAVKGLKVYRTLLDATATSAEAAATRIERAASRIGNAAANIGAGAQAMRTTAPGGGTRAGGGGGGGRRGGGGQSSPVIDDIVTRGARASAAQGGVAAGAKTINEATAALNGLGTASDRAKAKVSDLTAQIARNREEAARLRRQAVETGDSEGTLAARMKGLSVATGEAAVKLQAARRDLRALDGGLIDAVKSAGSFRGAIGAASVAVGTLAADAAKRGLSLVVDGLVGATDKAIKFETALADVRKVARGNDDTAEGFAKIEAGIKETSKALGVVPTQVAELTASLAPVFSGKEDLVSLAAEVTKVGVAWGITGKEAGKAFADTTAALGTTREQTSSLFGTINELSNNMNAQAPQIAQAVAQVGAVAKAAGISGETTAALSASLISTGASADVAAAGVRTFISRLAAGEAATDDQRKAFAALGTTAEETAKALTSGNTKEAEATIARIIKSVQGLDQDKRVSTLTQLFGSMSIGTIGALATNTELLGQSFALVADKGAAANSVQTEFDKRSATSAARIEKLKANVEVLAIELGTALLPYVTELVEFLTSPEGQTWGKNAVEGAVGAVKTLASVLKEGIDIVSSLVEAFGGATVAVGALGLALAGLAGPFATAAAAGIAAGTAIANAWNGAAMAMADMHKKANQIRQKEHEAEMKAGQSEADAQVAEFDRHNSANDRRAALAKREEDRLRAKGLSEVEISRRVAGMTLATQGEGRLFGGGTEDDRLEAWERTFGGAGGGGTSSGAGGGSDRAADESRFAELARMKNSSPDGLPPAEAKELRSLSKRLNKAIPVKPGKGHTATAMDKQLAAMSPEVRALLVRGGDRDAGGDGKVAGNMLDRAVFGSMTKGRGGMGVDGVGSVGPGPSITNNDNRQYHVQIQQAIDASSSNTPPAENLKRAAQGVATQTGEAVIRFTGGTRVLALQNGGARMV